jgi:hypothetical protein
MEMQKILQGFKDIADRHALLHEEAMIETHRINMCGLKRLHRIKSRKFHKHGLCIANWAQDHGFIVKFSDPKPGYKVKDLRDHLKKIVDILEQDMNKLKELNAAVMKHCGVPFADGIAMQHMICHVWAKAKFRWIPRFEYTKWNELDIVQWDKWLHDKK